MKLAFAHVTEPLYFLDASALAKGCEAARNSPRRRIILPIHRQLADSVQRFVNFLQPGTYAAPHYHPAPGFSETILVMSGQVAFFEFDVIGNIRQKRILTGGTSECLVDFVGEVIHSFVCLQEDTTLLEIKKGPYSAQTDKVFVNWAPGENQPGAPEFLARLEFLCN